MDLKITMSGVRNPKLPWLVALTRTSLEELEHEYLRVGVERCEYLRKQTQLAGFLLCGIRSLSLLRGMLKLLEPDFLDSHAVLHRAYLECWYMQFEFRRKGASAEQVANWFRSGSKLYKVDHRKLHAFLVQLGGKVPAFKVEYEALSNAAHPTSEAARSSKLVVTATSGMSKNGAARLRDVLHKVSDQYISLLSRELWLSLFDHADLIETGFRKEKLKAAHQMNDLFVLKRSKFDWGNLR